MRNGDFVLFDGSGDGEPSSPPKGGESSRSQFQKPSFLHYRGPSSTTSPLLDDVPAVGTTSDAFPQGSGMGMYPPGTMPPSAGGDRRSWGVQPSDEHVSPATIRATSPNVSPQQQQQPSSGTLGAPLNMLSLQGGGKDSSDSARLAAMFPTLSGGADVGAASQTGPMFGDAPAPPGQSGPVDPQASGGAPFGKPGGAGGGQPYVWEQGPSLQNTNAYDWQQLMASQGAQPNTGALRGTKAAQEYPTLDGSKSTVSPRDIYMDQELNLGQGGSQADAGRRPEPPSATPGLTEGSTSSREEGTSMFSPQVHGSLFPSQPPTFPRHAKHEDQSSPSTPFTLSSSMETSSSNEEEDDEDEKPFPSGSQNAPALGAPVPNEQLLDQWRHSIYAPSAQPQRFQGGNGAARRNVPSARLGPSFSAVSSSSESDEEFVDRPYEAMASSQTLARQGIDTAASAAAKFSRGRPPGTLGGYGYMPGSQESGLRLENDSTQMSASMTESEQEGDTGRRSPSIRTSAQAIESAAERSRSRERRPSSASPPRTTHRRTPSRARAAQESAHRAGDEQDDEEEDADVTMREARETSTSATDSESPANDGDSDYEQTERAAHATPTQRRGPRSTRTASGAQTGHRATGSDGGAQQQQQSSSGAPLSASAMASSLAASARSGGSAGGNRAPAVSGSAIRCNYVSPVTHQVCDTIFHRMYDLARHRITLHLREEAQMVKEGRLKVDDCTVLGKEVDVQKALAELEWSCRFCGASFSRKDAMLRHERLRHHR